MDCYENVIVQLRGRKNVTVYPPATVWDLEPDPASKHWPSGTAAAVARAARAAATVELAPGDALYVPLMYPHSVQSADFSVTSNAYLHLPPFGSDPWLDHIDRSKTNAFLAYEYSAGVRLC